MSAPYSQSPSGSCEVSQPPWMMSANVCVRCVEVEVQADGGGRRHHAIAVEPDELALWKQLEVLPVVRRLEALLVGERREHHALQLPRAASACSGRADAMTRPFGSSRR